MPTKFLKVSSIAVVLAARGGLAPAQGPVPLRFLAPEVRIEGHDLSRRMLWPIGVMAIGEDGRFLLFPNNSSAGINAFDAAGKVSPFHIQTGFRGDNEIMWPEHMGRFGRSYWVTDPFNHQVALVSADAKVVGGITNPTWVHPRWAERRRFPIFGGLEVVAVYPDTQLLVRPTRARTLLDTPDYDRRLTHLLRIDRDGQIQREIARFDEESAKYILNPAAAGSQQYVRPVPFGARTVWSAVDDGSRVAIVQPGVSAADSGSYRVTSIGTRGDTVFSRRFPMAVRRILPAQIDSALKDVHASGERPAESVRAEVRKKIPAFRSYVTDVIAGYDGSTWVVTRSPVDSSAEREALILDPRGDPLARVAVPSGYSLRHADRDHLWAIDRLKPGIVRLKVQATPPPSVTTAPPPRTAKASAAKE